MNGKGSKPRPLSVSRDEFAANWERIFGKKPAAKPRTATKAKAADVTHGFNPVIDLPWSHVLVEDNPLRIRSEEKGAP